MSEVLATRASAVWALLVGATVLSWSLGHGLGFSGAAASVAILVVTFIKVRLVVREFMEIRTAPRWMQRAADGWIAGCAALLIGLFLRAAGA